MTGLLASSATGRKLRPCLLVKGDPTRPIESIAGTQTLFSEKGWMTQRLFIKWVDFEFPFVRPNKILLVFDSARSHLAETVKEHLHRRGILFAVIPGGLTSLLQPCDVVWFKPLKTHLERSIDEWKSGGGHSLTRSGRPRPPTIDDMANWLASGWAAMNEQMLARSFDRCFLGDILFLHIAYIHYTAPCSDRV